VVAIPVVVAQRSGQLEPLMFDVSLLGFVVGRWSKTLVAAVALGLIAAASPVVVTVIQDPSEINVGVWILGVVFPWTIGRARVDSPESRSDASKPDTSNPARARAGS
jgi:hypothetical protein